MNECLKRTANTYRCLTARWRTLPHFLIIGAMRGGTTSLVNYLYRHPCVVRPQLPRFQEVHFFDLHYAHGPRWYRTHFPLTIRMRWLRRRRGAALTGESSPYYLYHPHAPRRAFSLVPHVAFDDRRLSHFTHVAQPYPRVDAATSLSAHAGGLSPDASRF
jgi:hypothetical protein